MNDSARLRKVINSKFQLKSSIDLFPKTEQGNLCPMIVWDEKTKDEWYKKEEDWHYKLLAGQRFHCKVCGIFTSNFNFTEYDDTYTSPERCWCKECETWWNCRQGFEHTLECLQTMKENQENREKENFERIVEDMLFNNSRKQSRRQSRKQFNTLDEYPEVD